MTIWSLTATAFKQLLRGYFIADGLSELELRQLYERWKEFAADDDRVKGQTPLFMVDNAEHAVAGLAWWEERQQGRQRNLWPRTAEDRAKMFLATEIDRQTLRPRPHCPGEYAGTWVFSGWYDDAGELVAAADEQEWLLHPDGRFEARGCRDRASYTWRAHEGVFLRLWLGPEEEPDRERWWVKGREGEEIELSSSAKVYRCKRVQSA